jgi:hypothetical protein
MWCLREGYRGNIRKRIYIRWLVKKFSDCLRKLLLKLYAGRVIIRRDLLECLNPAVVFLFYFGLDNYFF